MNDDDDIWGAAGTTGSVTSLLHAECYWSLGHKRMALCSSSSSTRCDEKWSPEGVSKGKALSVGPTFVSRGEKGEGKKSSWIFLETCSPKLWEFKIQVWIWLTDISNIETGELQSRRICKRENLPKNDLYKKDKPNLPCSKKKKKIKKLKSNLLTSR